jgi:hypothetical protein
MPQRVAVAGLHRATVQITRINAIGRLQQPSRMNRHGFDAASL